MKQDILNYPVILTEYTDDGHYYVVTSPNISGMVTDGKNITEAITHVEDATATMLDGIDYPAVQDPKLWKLNANQEVAWVTVNMTKWLTQHDK
nr:type II toxin-antitoxin system HicB family antitoxin [Limosilactobacillus mucosae]